MTPDQLRRIAEAATKGPWEWERPSEDDFPQHDQSLVTTWKENDGHPATVLHSWGYDASGTEAEPQDRLFIATFNPKRVLELLDERDRLATFHDHEKGRADELETERDRLEARLAAVEKLHYAIPSTVSALYPDPLCSCGKTYPCDTIKAARGE